MRATWSAVLAIGAALVVGPTARAWQVEDRLHSNCHERLTQAALDGTGYVTPPPRLAGDDLQLFRNVPFTAAGYDDNIDALALIIGCREPDEKNVPSFDFYDLSTVHNDPATQHEHCLRSPGQDGPAGDAAALASCRDDIAAHYWAALASLDEFGEVDTGKRVLARLFVANMGSTDYPLPEFYYHAGIALHVVQDAFTHTYRSPDWMQVHAVCNWSDQIACDLDVARDGPGHVGLFDNCAGTFASNQPRFDAAKVASTELLQALTEPGDHITRQQRLDVFFQNWFRYQAGCDVNNRFCDNASYNEIIELDELKNTECDSCSALTPSGAGWGALATMGLLWLRQRRRRGWRAEPLLVAALVAALALPAISLAQTDVANAPADEAAVPSPASVPAPADSAAAPASLPQSGCRHCGLRTEVRGGASIMNPALAVGVNEAWRWERFEVGLFAELNPWQSIERMQLNLGTANVGLFAHYLHPISDDFSLRFGLGAGSSTLLQELIGSPIGTTGIFISLHLLGFVWHFHDNLALVVDGADLALPAPQLSGWPILYAQHRFTVGLQF